MEAFSLWLELAREVNRHFLVESGFRWRRSWSRKSASKKSKIRVVSGVMSSTELELQTSEQFHFLPIPLMTPTPSMIQ